MMRHLMLVALILVIGGVAMAQPEHAAAPATQQSGAHDHSSHAHAHGGADSQPHPVLSTDSSWAGVMVIVVAGMFLAAAVIGPIIRANMPDEPPPVAHHDDHGHDAHGHDAHGGHGHGH